MAAACELVAHLAATEADPLGEDSPVMVQARNDHALKGDKTADQDQKREAY